MTYTPDADQLSTEDKVKIIMQKIKHDDWTSHIQVDDATVTQLVTLLDKHFHIGMKTLDIWDALIRFYMFGFLTGQLKQKWKDEGLDLTPDEIQLWTKHNLKQQKKAEQNRRYKEKMEELE